MAAKVSIQRVHDEMHELIEPWLGSTLDEIPKWARKLVCVYNDLHNIVNAPPVQTPPPASIEREASAELVRLLRQRYANDDDTIASKAADRIEYLEAYAAEAMETLCELLTPPVETKAGEPAAWLVTSPGGTPRARIHKPHPSNTYLKVEPLFRASPQTTPEQRRLAELASEPGRAVPLCVHGRWMSEPCAECAKKTRESQS